MLVSPRRLLLFALAGVSLPGIALLLVLWLAPGWLAQVTVTWRYPDVEQVSGSWLEQRLQSGSSTRSAPWVVDVRTREEFAVSHIPGSIHATDTASVARALPDSPTPVVLVCSIGWRSSALAARLQRGGWDEVRNLNGGLFAWAEAGRPLVATVDGTQRAVEGVHPFNQWWGRLLERDLWRWSRAGDDEATAPSPSR